MIDTKQLHAHINSATMNNIPYKALTSPPNLISPECDMNQQRNRNKLETQKNKSLIDLLVLSDGLHEY